MRDTWLAALSGVAVGGLGMAILLLHVLGVGGDCRVTVGTL